MNLNYLENLYFIDEWSKHLKSISSNKESSGFSKYSLDSLIKPSFYSDTFFFVYKHVKCN